MRLPGLLWTVTVSGLQLPQNVIDVLLPDTLLLHGLAERRPDLLESPIEGLMFPLQEAGNTGNRILRRHPDQHLVVRRERVEGALEGCPDSPAERRALLLLDSRLCLRLPGRDIPQALLVLHVRPRAGGETGGDRLKLLPGQLHPMVLLEDLDRLIEREAIPDQEFLQEDRHRPQPLGFLRRTPFSPDVIQEVQRLALNHDPEICLEATSASVLTEHAVVVLDELDHDARGELLRILRGQAVPAGREGDELLDELQVPEEELLGGEVAGGRGEGGHESLSIHMIMSKTTRPLNPHREISMGVRLFERRWLSSFGRVALPEQKSAMLSTSPFRGWPAAPMKRTAKGLVLPGFCIFLILLWLRPADVRKSSPSRGVGVSPTRLVWGRFTGQDSSEQSILSPAECQQTRQERDKRDVHRLALLFARCGEVRRSIQLLQGVLKTRPHAAEAWSDLAAAHLNVGDPRSLAQALKAAEKAVTEDGALPAALFNRAQALELLSLAPRASLAWENYLNLDSSSTWAVIAQKRLNTLRRPPESDLWEDLKNDLVQGKALPLVSGRVVRFRQQARLLVEEDLLERWALHFGRGDSTRAAIFLGSSRAIASELARLHEDLLLRDSVNVIDGAGQGTLKALKTAHLEYAEAMRLVKDGEFSTALKRLERARELFSSGESPFAEWAAFQSTVCLYQASRYDEALAILEDLEGRARARSYHSLEARVLWLQGTILTFTARPAEALKRYKLAHQIFSNLGERDYAAAVSTLLAKSLEILGQNTSAWEYRFEALRIVSRSGDLVRTRVSFAEAASAFAALGEPQIGLLFQEESLRAARLLRKPSALTAALRQRASLHFAAGLFLQARSDLEQAREEAVQLRDPFLREAVENELALVESEILLKEEPGGALFLLDRTIERTVQAEDRLYLPSLYIARYRAHRLLRHLEEADADLRSALAEVEGLRGGIADPKIRISYFDQKQSLIDEIVQFQLTERRNARAALEFVERGRARMLAEWLSQVADVSAASIVEYSSWSLRELQRNLRPGVAVLVYFISDDLGYVWVITGNEFTLRILPVTSKEIREKAIELDVRRTDESSHGFKELLGQLFERMVRPALDAVPEGAHLVIVPDDDMNGIPFSALLDLTAERYLIENHTLAIAPSLRVYLQAESRARMLVGAAPSVLAIGDPSIDLRRFSGLLPLSSARKEAEKVFGLYGRGRLLLGKEATREQFLEGIRNSDVIHFAGHALSNQDNPFLSALLFASSSQDSGVLYAWELLERDFKRTRLVVLSACSTAAEEKDSSEEMLSLVTPFLAAGVPAVVGSLWDVDDDEVQPFMEEFHRRLSQEMPPGITLQEVKKLWLMERHSARSDPRLWGAFEVFGTGGDP